ncbi:hypothetical protein [Hydrogenophaga sp.]|uniref:hypothetical protein n=1 Tax=Hydrogenophaga sp. TaxID=1904254 RepID=UPI0025BE8D95|nr:hypothetical protein [Hydrogenophaga sp.]
MIRSQTLFAALAAALSLSAAVASAATDVPRVEDARLLTVQEQSRLRLSVHEFATRQIEWQRQMQRQLQERERIKTLSTLSGKHASEPLQLQAMVQNRIQTREQTNTHDHVRTQTRTQSMSSQTSGSSYSGRSGSGKR